MTNITYTASAPGKPLLRLTEDRVYHVLLAAHDDDAMRAIQAHHELYDTGQVTLTIRDRTSGNRVNVTLTRVVEPVTVADLIHNSI